MGADEPLVWYADSDDPYDTVRHSGGPLVAIALLTVVLVACFAGGHGASSAVLLVPGALVPLAAIAAAWEFVVDRRAVVEMRLADGELTLIRANRTITRYPLGEVRRIETVRYVRGGDPTSSRMRLHIGDRVERTRTGPADLPERWTRALSAAEVDVRIRDKQGND